MRKCPASHLGAINRDSAGSALAESRTIRLESEFDCVSAGRQSCTALDSRPREVQQIIDEHRLALEEVESPAAKPAALGGEHAIATTGRHLDICGDREGLV